MTDYDGLTPEQNVEKHSEEAHKKETANNARQGGFISLTSALILGLGLTGGFIGGYINKPPEIITKVEYITLTPTITLTPSITPTPTATPQLLFLDIASYQRAIEFHLKTYQGLNDALPEVENILREKGFINIEDLQNVLGIELNADLVAQTIVDQIASSQRDNMTKRATPSPTPTSIPSPIPEPFCVIESKSGNLNLYHLPYETAKLNEVLEDTERADVIGYSGHTNFQNLFYLIKRRGSGNLFWIHANQVQFINPPEGENHPSCDRNAPMKQIEGVNLHPKP